MSILYKLYDCKSENGYSDLDYILFVDTRIGQKHPLHHIHSDNVENFGADDVIAYKNKTKKVYIYEIDSPANEYGIDNDIVILEFQNGALVLRSTIPQKDDIFHMLQFKIIGFTCNNLCRKFTLLFDTSISQVLHQGFGVSFCPFECNYSHVGEIDAGIYDEFAPSNAVAEIGGPDIIHAYILNGNQISIYEIILGNIVLKTDISRDLIFLLQKSFEYYSNTKQIFESQKEGNKMITRYIQKSNDQEQDMVGPLDPNQPIRPTNIIRVLNELKYYEGIIRLYVRDSCKMLLYNCDRTNGIQYIGDFHDDDDEISAALARF